MRPASYRLEKAGYAIFAAALLAAIDAGVPTNAADRVGPNGHDVQAILKGQLAKHPEEVRRFVKDYLVNNPQALQEALVELMQRRMPSAADRAAAIGSNAAAMFNSDKRVVLGNPGGDVTLVEFVDYNCGFCRRALRDMLELAKTDAKLRIVLIEHPVLGPGSVEAARVAIALQMQDRDPATYSSFTGGCSQVRGSPTRLVRWRWPPSLVSMARAWKSERHVRRWTPYSMRAGSLHAPSASAARPAMLSAIAFSSVLSALGP
jgi:hypothetical protein